MPPPLPSTTSPPPPPSTCSPGPYILFFDWDATDLTPQAEQLLDNAAEYYRACGYSRLTSAGHTDRSGVADYNVGLSLRRAERVRSSLASRGVPESALVTEAFGESRPLVETADGVRESQNRRVEISFGHVAR